ncbi:hemerythrin domain-containing protein [Nocardioides jishulii]|uniref:Hemerythrin domain-containing protein n=1 Tax=Nocardioides jishulii TaxID=2575440 RepID=A0A4U2YJI3_9ACTN|nr:hemerythrin domain-containing protein [Nocardioides jishulii]QCX26804.1 hemerythrin domain-containing protein [Nocardioides jishulii]TKI61288.1 hemerythrin domain-containing protein [Nocardioides jishulii]
MTTPAETTPGGRFSIVALQKRDHERLEELLDELASAPDATARSRTLGQIARLVFPHAFAEESLLWPVVRRTVPFGEALTSGVEQEHQEVNELWRRLETLHHPDDLDEDHQALLARLAEVLREDVRDEEDRILPRLEETLSPAQLRMIGVGWEVLRRTAPSRPHPVVSRRPPGNVLAAVPLTVLDRSRDVLDEVSLRSSRLAGVCRGASARLGEVAARVERIGVLREGETVETRRTPGTGRIRFVGGAPDKTPPGPV